MNSNSTTPPARQVFPDPIPGIIPFGSFCVFGGLARVGKTTFLAQWIRAWRAGQPILQQPTHRPVEICYLASDRPWALYAPLFGDAPPDKSYSVADDQSFNLGRFRQPFTAFEYCLDQLDPAPGALLVVDPVAPLFIAGSQNDPRVVALSLHELRRILYLRCLTGLCLVHFHKPRGEQDQSERGIDKISGSGAFSGFSDVQMYLHHQQPTEEFQVFGWNPPHAPLEEVKLIRNAQGFFEPYTISDLERQLTDPGLKAQQVLDLLPDDEAVATKTLEQRANKELQMSRPTFFRTLKTLEEAGLIQRRHGLVCKRKIH